jgi:hypothetical protein
MKPWMKKIHVIVGFDTAEHSPPTQPTGHHKNKEEEWQKKN